MMFLAAKSKKGGNELAYNLDDLTRLRALQALAQRSKQEFAAAGDVAELRQLIESLSSSGMPSFDNAGSHNSIFRGKNLGGSVTAAQYEAIGNGTFKDLYIGDYWTIGGVNYRIAAFDYYFNTGDTACTQHHAVIVPDKRLYTHVMNDTDITTGGYAGSKMHTQGLEQSKTTIKAAFGGHVLSHRIYLTNAVANGKASNGAWFDSEVDLMSEHMVYGNGVFSPVSDGSSVPANNRICKSQLPLFMFRPDLISNNQWYWLRDVVSAAYFARVGGTGYANYGSASAASGVRPAFLIS